MTQKVLAEKINVSNKAVSRWETGDGLPDIHVLPLLSQALHVSLDDLLSESSSPAHNHTPRKVEHMALTHSAYIAVAVIVLSYVPYDLPEVVGYRFIGWSELFDNVT